MLKISNKVLIPDDEIDLSAIRAQGAGGQNVNKVSSAIHLRFDISASSLPDFYKERLLGLKDNRINKAGILVIKAQKYRTKEKNKTDALERLKDLIINVSIIKKARRATKPSKASKRRRINMKKQRGQTKALRGRIKE